MDSITHNKRYLPHKMSTKLNSALRKIVFPDEKQPFGNGTGGGVSMPLRSFGGLTISGGDTFVCGNYLFSIILMYSMLCFRKDSVSKASFLRLF